MSSALPIKVVLLGATEVGKTSIASRFAFQTFDIRQKSTLGVSFLTRNLNIEHKPVQFEIWDTAGQEKFRSVTMSYLRDARAAIFVYDLSKPDTLQYAIDFASNTYDLLQDNAIYIFVGNKSDLFPQPSQQAIDFAQSHGFMHFTCSAKTGENIDNIFYVIGKKINELPQPQSPPVKKVSPQSSEKQSVCC